MTPKKINQLIAEDVKQKSGCTTAYALFRKYKIANVSTMHNLLTAKSAHNVNLTILFQLYKAMGYNGISIQSEGITIEIVPVKKD